MLPLIIGAGAIVAGYGAKKAYDYFYPAKHPGTAAGQVNIQTPPIPLANGGTSYKVVAPGGYTASFVTKPAPVGSSAVPTTNLTTGAAFDSVTLVPGAMAGIANAAAKTTDFLLQVPAAADGTAGGGIASVTSDNPSVMPGVAPIPTAGQAAALDIGAPLKAGTANLQIAWIDAGGTPQNTTLSITAV